MKLKIDRIDQHALTDYINRVKLIDSFIYMKVIKDRVESTVYLPQRDAVKKHSVDLGQVFQTEQDIPSDKELKIAFFDGSKVIGAIKHFEHDAIKGEIEFVENDDEYVASTFRIYNDELEVKLACSEPSLGFKDLTQQQEEAIFSVDNSSLNFSIDTHMSNKVKNLFNLDTEETFNISAGEKGANINGKSFNVLVNPESKGVGEVTVYKKYLNLLDKEDQTVFVSDSKVVFQSNETETMLTVSTCQTT
jgi:hypothetical protein